MPVSSPFIIYVGGTAWDLRKVSAVIEPADKPSSVYVRFIDNPHNTVELDRASFEAAWQAALDAGIGGGGGGSGVISVNGKTGTVVLVPDDIGAASAAFVNLSAGSGIAYGGVLSIGVGGTTFNVSAGVGYIINNWTAPLNPTVTKITWSAMNGVAATHLGSSVSSSILLDSSGAVVQRTTPFGPDDYRDYLVLGKLVHPASTIVSVAQFQRSLPSASLFATDLAGFLGPIAQGCVITPNDGNLLLDRSSGWMLRCGANYTNSLESPNIVSVPAASPLSFQYRYRNGSGGFVASAPTTSVNPSVYDDGSGTLTDPSPNKYTNQRVYVFPSGNSYIVPGQTVYGSLSAAVAAIPYEPIVLDPQLADANLRAVISVKRGATQLNDTSDALVTFGGIFGVGGSGGGGGAASGGSPTGAAGGDLAGNYPNPTVRQVTPTNKTLTWNPDGSLASVTDSWGSKTMSYSGGKLAGITGTGIYASKTLSYTGGQLTAITVS